MTTVHRWFVIGADGSTVDGPFRKHSQAKAAMLEQRDYLRFPDWYSLKRKTYRIPKGNVGGMRAPGRGQNGWMQERDELKGEWENASADH